MVYKNELDYLSLREFSKSLAEMLIAVTVSTGPVLLSQYMHACYT